MAEIEIQSIGKLKPHPENPEEWLISEPVPVEFFDGKNLRFSFDAHSFAEESFSSDANRVVRSFLTKDAADRAAVSKPVYENYQVLQNWYDSEMGGIEPLKLKDSTDIWKYVYPTEINVCKMSGKNENIYLLVYCECEWEPEHGLQLVFENGDELTRVSGIDCSPIE